MRHLGGYCRSTTSCAQKNGLDPGAITNGLPSNGNGKAAAAAAAAPPGAGDAAPQDHFDSVASVAPVGAEAGLDAKTAEDYWSPQCPPAAPFQDDYGTLQPLPQHDGTECLKWDDSLRSHTEHFKVRCSGRASASAEHTNSLQHEVLGTGHAMLAQCLPARACLAAACVHAGWGTQY